MDYTNLKNEIMREYPVLVIDKITEIGENEYLNIVENQNNLTVYDLSSNDSKENKYYYGSYGIKSVIIILNNKSPSDPYLYSLWTTYNFYLALVKQHCETVTFSSK